jgi:hypothetical protein
MTHGVFPIEMFCCIIVEILLILETKLQSCQVLTNKLGLGDTVQIYNRPFVGLFWNETIDTFQLE